jgi:hypothetical protein
MSTAFWLRDEMYGEHRRINRAGQFLLRWWPGYVLSYGVPCAILWSLFVIHDRTCIQDMTTWSVVYALAMIVSSLGTLLGPWLYWAIADCMADWPTPETRHHWRAAKHVEQQINAILRGR